MKNTFFFWQNWGAGSRFLYLFYLLVFTLAAGWFSVAAWQGREAVMDWNTEGNIEAEKMVLDRFSRAFFQLEIDADTFITIDRFEGSPMTVNLTATDFYLAGLAFAFLSLLILAGYAKKRLGFILPVIFFILFLSTNNFELLASSVDVIQAGDPNKYFLISSLLILVGASAAFYVLKKSIPFLVRLLTLSGLAGGLLYYLLNHYALVENPGAFIAGHGVLIPVIMTVVFIGFNAHEIPRAILLLATRGGKSSSNTWAFAGGTMFYLLYLFLTFLQSIKMIDWDILYLNPFLVFLFTSILGIWGFKGREVQYENIFSFAPWGALLYLSLGILSFSTMGYVLATGNSPMVEVFEDAIMFTHIGYGVVFIGYVVYNFSDIIDESGELYKVLWKPMMLDYLTTSMFGSMIVVLFLFRNDFFPVRQALAGQNNQIADAYRVEGDLFLATEYYDQARNYDARNFKANYNLAHIFQVAQNKEQTELHYRKALEGTPSPRVYINLASHLQRRYLQDEAIRMLEKGLDKFPRSGEIMNNLGLLYVENKQFDDAVEMLNKARQLATLPEVPETNLFGLWAKYKINLRIEELVPETKSVVAEANRLAYNARDTSALSAQFRPEFMQDTVLNSGQVNYIYNYALLNPQDVENELTERLKTYSEHPENLANQDFLVYAHAVASYYQGDAYTALKNLRQMAEYSQTVKAGVPHTLAMWYLQHNDAEQAARFFQKTVNSLRLDASVSKAIALSELEDKAKAIELWTAWDTIPGNPIQPTAHQMLQLLQASPTDIAWLENDELRYQFLYYRMPELSDETCFALIQKLENLNLAAQASIQKIELYLAQGKTQDALILRNDMEGLVGLDPLVLSRLRLTDLRLLEASNRLNELKPLLAEEATESRETSRWWPYYAGLSLLQEGDTTKALNAFEKASKSVPLSPKPWLKQVEILKAQYDFEAAYRVLLTALELNKKSVVLSEKYILLAAKLNYTQFAEDALRELRYFAPEADFKRVEAAYEEVKAEKAREFEAWQEGKTEEK